MMKSGVKVKVRSIKGVNACGGGHKVMPSQGSVYYFHSYCYHYEKGHVGILRAQNHNFEIMAL